MRKITLSHNELPNLSQRRVGDQVTLTIEGLITRIETEPVDASGYDQPLALTSEYEADIVVVQAQIKDA